MTSCNATIRNINDFQFNCVNSCGRPTRMSPRVELDYPGSSYWAQIGRQQNCCRATDRVHARNNFMDGEINSRKALNYSVEIISPKKGDCRPCAGKPMPRETYNEERIGRYTNVNDVRSVGTYNPLYPYNMYFNNPIERHFYDTSYRGNY